jgi:hypothetical protein
VVVSGGLSLYEHGYIHSIDVVSVLLFVGLNESVRVGKTMVNCVFVIYTNYRETTLRQLLRCLVLYSPFVLRLLCAVYGTISYFIETALLTRRCCCHRNAPISTKDLNCSDRLQTAASCN